MNLFKRDETPKRTASQRAAKVEARIRKLEKKAATKTRLANALKKLESLKRKASR